MPRDQVGLTGADGDGFKAEADTILISVNIVRCNEKNAMRHLGEGRMHPSDAREAG